MNKTGFIISGSIAIVTILFVVAYSLFNVFGVTQSRVKRNEITIVTASAEKLYDTLSLSDDSWYLESGGVAEGDTLVVVVNSSITNPGSIENAAGVTIFDAEGKNVTLNYNIIYKTGTLTVRPIEISIKTESKEKRYDGSPLSYEVWQMTSGSLFRDDRIEIVMSSSITEPGVIDNEIGVTIYNEDNEVVNNIYKINYDIGTLTVRGIAVTFTTEDIEKLYDGEALFGGTATLRAGVLSPQHHVEFGVETSITNPGSVTNEIDIRIIDNDGKDVTSSYAVTTDFGTLTINPREITIETESDTKLYDGTPLINHEWFIKEGQLAENHRIAYVMSAKITNPGEVDNTIDITILNDLNEDVTGQYEVQTILGTLTVEAIDITFTTDTLEKGYDGTILMGGEAEITMGELPETHRAVFGAESSITNPGTIDNEIDIKILDAEGNDVTNVYNITEDFGTLKVLPIQLVFKSNDAEKVYDGTALFDHEWEMISGVIADDFTLDVEVDEQLTYAGSIENTIKAYITNSDGIDVSDLYDIEYITGTLTVTPLEITLTSITEEKAYDGEALLGGDATLEGTLAATDRLIYGTESTITKPGSIINEIDIRILNGEDKNVTSSYRITYDEGSLTILPIQFVLKSTTEEKVYDGLPLFNDEWELLGDEAIEDILLENHRLIVDVDSQLTFPGSIENTINAYIVNELDNDVSDLYDIEYITGSLTVTPREIAFSTITDAKDYDGTELLGGEATMYSGQLVANHEIEYGQESSITNPGLIYNEIPIRIIDGEGNDVTAGYNITKDFGTLTVNAITILVQSDSESKTYDGLPLSNDIWNVISGTLLDGHSIDVIMNSQITEAGSIANKMVAYVEDEAGNNVSDFYDFIYDEGTLTINPRNITFSTITDSKDYDGTPLLGGVVTMDSGSFAVGDDVEYGIERSITEPGTISNNPTITILNSEDSDVTDSYNITYNSGSLTVDAIILVFESGSNSKTYDGTPLTNNVWNLLSGSLLEDHVPRVIMNSEITEAGSTDNVMIAIIEDEFGNNVSDIYEFDYREGLLTVNQRNITISTITDSQAYDGTPLTGGFGTLESGTLATGDDFEYGLEKSITEPGSISNNPTVTILNSNNNDVTDSYNITYDSGTLTVEAITLQIQSESESKVYDGTPLSNDGWTLLSGSLLAGHYLDITINNEITTAGTLANTMAIVVRDAQDNDVSDIYDIDEVTGTLTVTQRDITIFTSSYEKAYDGTPLLGGLGSLQAGSLVAGENIQYGTEASLTNIGFIINELGITILNAQNADVTSSYNITTDFGTLLVTPVSLTIQSNTDSKVYDGTPLSNDGYTVTSGTLLDGHVLTVTMNSEITYAGVIANEMIASVVDEFGNSVSSLYDFTYVEGTLTIQKIDVTYQTEPLEKTYDGSPLLGGDATLTSGALLATDHVVFGAEASITLPGTISNERTITILDSNNNDVTSSYNITTNFGTLTVNKITLIIKSESASKVYDGTPLIHNVWEILFGSTLAGHNLNVDIDNQITDVGTIDNSLYAYITDDLGNLVTGIYDIEYSVGTLSIFSSAYSSSNIATSSFDVPTEDAFKVYSSETEGIYFKDRTFGDYDYNSWTGGTVQDTDITVNPLSFSAAALVESGVASTLIQVEYVRSQIPYLLPYYTADFINELNDIHISGDTSGILDFNYINYAYNELSPVTIQNEELSSQEVEYQTYVYANYLAIPADTKQSMLDLATENGLSADSPTIISDVKNYISNAAIYNLDFETYPDGVDVAVYFLTESKEGICQHYATAATLMYRALGLPARYTTGYYAQTEAGTWTTITGEFAHAWVEVYMDGFGWVTVEVTGGGAGGVSGGAGGGGTVVEPIDITVQPQTVREAYEDGKVITASVALVLGYPEFTSEGYTTEATFGGSLSTVGIASSSITSLIIRDSEGNDVTTSFNITLNEGVLQLYEHNIELVTSTDSKEYNGEALTNDNWILNGTLESGHYVGSITFIGEQTDVGSSLNRAILLIFDADGNDVTGQYNLSYTFGTLSVTPTAITVESNDATKVFDGTALINHEYSITSGALALSDSIEVTITGSQTGIGKSSNTIASIHIYNNGVDVTSNYTIYVLEGDLTVTPPY